jgi:four helix bundle protein
MREPRQLEVTEHSLRIAELTYRLTKGFPPDERFGLVAQMRRATIAVGSNIAEGCGRSTDRAFVTFIESALGSLLELDYQAQVAARLGHGDAQLLTELRGANDHLKRMLASLAGAIRRKRTAAPAKQREAATSAPSFKG